MEAFSDVKESDAFKAIKKLNATTGAEIPDDIKNLKEKPILHNITVEKDKIAETILNVMRG